MRWGTRTSSGPAGSGDGEMGDGEMAERSNTPTMRLSPLRLILVVVACMAAVGATVLVAERAKASLTAVDPVNYQPYLDVTLTPTTHFEDPSSNRATSTVLAFVVADPSDGCRPTWGTHYSLEAAGRALDLDRRIARYRERGGDVVVSFGGQANEELAVACEDPEQLAAAYLEVIERYDVEIVDFDIEGEALLDVAANQRRAEALELVQAKTGVDVWLTLPVAGHGLLDTGVAVLDTTLGGGVEVDVVNLMTMNFGGSRRADATMGEATIEAIEAARPQIDAAYRRVGTVLTIDEVRARMAATVMLGQNDVAADRFDMEDARSVRSFAADEGLAFVGAWSMNRDAPCGGGSDASALSNTCSGVKQSVGEFAETFLADVSVGPDEQIEPPVEVVAIDPELSPYPRWRETKAYEQGSKIVWQGRVYEAKWWSENEVPDAPVENDWDSPWRYLGPLTQADVDLAMARAAEETGTWPRWQSEAVYVAGDEVEHDERLYRASWWTQGDTPDFDPDQPFDHPWEYLGQFVRADRFAGEITGSDADRVFIAADPGEG